MKWILFHELNQDGQEETLLGSLQSPYDNVFFGDRTEPADSTRSGTCGGVVPATSYGGRPRFTIRGIEITREQARQVLLGRCFESATE